MGKGSTAALHPPIPFHLPYQSPSETIKTQLGNPLLNLRATRPVDKLQTSHPAGGSLAVWGHQQEGTGSEGRDLESDGWVQILASFLIHDVILGHFLDSTSSNSHMQAA